MTRDPGLNVVPVLNAARVSRCTCGSHAAPVRSRKCSDSFMLPRLCGAAEPLDGEEYLDISGITRTQAGRYECRASNDVASPDVKYINVIVNYAPFIKDTKSSDPQVGRMGVLQCEASAIPKPEFEWYRDDKRLSNGQGISIQMMGSRTLLLVSNVTEEDYGNYTCVATNRLGIHNASVFLYRPGTANSISGAVAVSQSLWLLLGSLTCLLLKC
ncbi:hypothetical protein ACEWY4_008856 [Coilia grayii]|uniref:Ig-like domain-containing protein n=1 Tax=Coilia grayii TaxID=363190 RepID=A0ABD1KCX6_9TELE